MDDCAIKGLARRQKRMRDPLGAAPTADPIPASDSIAVPNPQAASGGIDSPLTEQAYAGSIYYSLTSSDGLFVFEFADETEYLDDANREVLVKHLDPDA